MAPSEVEPPSSPPTIPLSVPPFISRKRSYLEEPDYSTSSDAVFSSDDNQDGIENYHRHRPKKMFRGAWWDNRKRRASVQTKEELKRNVDSGVWMGSDQSIDLPAASNHGSDLALSFDGPNDALENSAEPIGELPVERMVAEAVITRCCEYGREVVDLSGLQLTLESLPNLAPLNTLIRQPVATETPPNSDAYAPFQPSLVVTLVDHRLDMVPRQLCQISNITVLSLRNGNLRYVPPAIAELVNLVELNISINKLHYLPYELLSLLRRGKLRNIKVTNNDWVTPYPTQTPTANQPQSYQDECLERGRLLWDKLRKDVKGLCGWKEPHLGRIPTTGLQTLKALGDFPWGLWEYRYNLVLERRILEADPEPVNYSEVNPYFMGASEMQFLPQRSAEDRYSTLPPVLNFDAFEKTQDDRPIVFAIPGERATFPEAPKKVTRSLFELALTKCVEQGEVPDIRGLMQEPPPLIDKALAYAEYLEQNVGDRSCSICGRVFFMPYAAWIEYWSLRRSWMDPLADPTLRESHMLPFLRGACTAECGHEARKEELPF